MRAVRLSGKAINLSSALSLGNPNHVFADASGPNRFGYQDGEAMRVFGGVVDRLTGDIQFVDGRLEAMNIVSEGLRLAESNQVGDVRIASFVCSSSKIRPAGVERWR